MNIGKKEINSQIKALVGQPLSPISSGSQLILEGYDSKNDTLEFVRTDTGKKIIKKFSYMRIIIESMLEFPAVNPSQILGIGNSALREIIILLANLPCIAYLKEKSNIYLSIVIEPHPMGQVRELLPGEAARIMDKVKKFEALDRKYLLQQLADTFNNLNFLTKQGDNVDASEIRQIVKQLKEFKDESDLIFSEEGEDQSLDIDLESEVSFLDIYEDTSDDEDEDDNSDEGFDPSKLDIKTVNPTIDLIMTRIRYKDIKLDPDFQRNDRIWKDVDKSALIESILLKIPIPVFYMSADEDDNWLVVDGLQRLTTIYDFVNDKFRLKGLKILSTYGGLKFSQFPRSLSRRIKETEFVVHVIQAGSPENATTEIFHRINTRGEKLSRQEIRSSLNVGESTKFLRKLAESKEFITATNRSISPNRMTDMEFVLRFCSFYLQSDISNVNITKMDTFLTNTMKRLNKEEESSELLQKIEFDFKKAMRAARALFGPYAFRKKIGVTTANQINKALFETWSVCLARLTDNEIQKLISNKNDLVGDAIKLMDGRLVLADWLAPVNKDKDFEFSISQSTSKKDMVRHRYLSIEKLIGNILNNDF